VALDRGRRIPAIGEFAQQKPQTQVGISLAIKKGMTNDIE
jgi:hypothetical protein